LRTAATAASPAASPGHGTSAAASAADGGTDGIALADTFGQALRPGLALCRKAPHLVG